MSKIELLNIPLFAELDRVHKAKLLTQFTQHSFHSGEMLFEEGEFGDSLYIIVQGRIRIFLQSDHDRTLAVLGERESLGEMSLLTGDPRSAAACAETDAIVLRLAKEEFDTLLREHSSLAVQFAGILARRIAALNKTTSHASTVLEPELQFENNSTSPLSKPGIIQRDKKTDVTSLPNSAKKLAEYANNTTLWNRQVIWRSLFSIFLGAIIYLVLFYATDLPQFIRLYCLFIGAGITGVFIKAWTKFIAASFIFVGISITELTDTKALLSGFAKPHLFTGIAFALCAQIIFLSGMFQRLILTLIIRFSIHKVWLYTILTAIGALSPILLPSSRHRRDVLQVAFPIKKAVEYLIPSVVLFIQGSLIGWFVLTVLDVPLTSKLFSVWLMIAFPLFAVISIFLLISYFISRKNSTDSVIHEKSVLEDNLLIFGSWSRKDTLSMLIMMLTIPTILISWPVEVSFLWVGVSAFAFLYLIHGNNQALWSEKELSEWVVFGLLAGLTQPFLEWSVSPEGSAFSQQFWAGKSPLVPLLLLFIIVASLRRKAGSLLSSWIGLLVTISAWTYYELSPVLPAIVTMLAVYVGNIKENSILTAIRLWARRAALSCFSIVIVFPVWQSMDLGNTPSQAAVSEQNNSKFILDVILPENENEALSVKRGIDFAFSELKDSSTKFTEIEVRYIQEGALKDNHKPATLGIAVTPSEMMNPEIPWIILQPNQLHPIKLITSGKQIFYLSQSQQTDLEHQELLRQLVEQGIESIVIYYDQTSRGRELAKLLENEAKRVGVTTIDRIMLVKSAEMNRQFLNKWSALEANAIIVYDPSHEVSSILRNEMIPEYNPLIIEIESQQTVNPQIQDYKDRYGIHPDTISASAYDAFMLSIESAQNSHTKSPNSMVETLSQIRAWSGMISEYELNFEGDHNE
ncbi:cyclic nucleotide-binding domain-containing protein [Bacillus sp. Marseille-P3661]|uniref:cyclic nucleotide-binding domain-containing protein n=1 Tax=Bacillus sp. Marseille-P3661 TaxID=1936234 RepID=UPI000C836FA1|nr:cyclic nucleotide-binding domain-containing protein [Bacillus sp. Marseille-P3661]